MFWWRNEPDNEAVVTTREGTALTDVRKLLAKQHMKERIREMNRKTVFVPRGSAVPLTFDGNDK